MVTIKTLKLPLKNIQLSDKKYDKLYDAIERANMIIFETYHFLRYYILHLYNNNKKIIFPTNALINNIFKLLSEKDNRGRKSSNLNDDLINFYNDNYSKINNIKTDSTNLSFVLNEASKSIVISYTNNVQLNFIKYARQYINEIFKIDFLKDFEIKNNEKVKIDRKLYNNVLNQIKNDIFENTYKSDKKYHNWINKIKKDILPQREDKMELLKDIKINYEKYLEFMLFMNKELESKKTESNKLKIFQPLPLRTSLTDCNIAINTAALVDIFIERNDEFFNYVKYNTKMDLIKNTHEIQHDLWNYYFNLGKKNQLKNYPFNYQIETDGISVSLNCIYKGDIEKNNKIKSLKAIGRNNGIQIRKDKTQEEINKINEDKKMADKKKKLEKLNKKEENKPKTIEEKEKVKEKIAVNNKFKYVDSIIKYKNNPNIKKLRKRLLKNKNKLVFIDPGKRTLLFMMSYNGKYFRYNNRRRLRETKRLKFNKRTIRENNKTKINDKLLSKYYEELSKFSAKSMNEKEFIEFAKIKIMLKRNIQKEKRDKGDNYNTILRKKKWYTYINKQRHEDKMVNEIKKVYGKDAILIIGDWSDKGRVNYISTPNIALKNKLSKHFEVYLIDEYNTSKINYKTEEENEKLQLKITNKKTNEIMVKEMHSIFTYKMSENSDCIGCLNRDKNSVNNMKKITNSILDKLERPLKYKRINKKIIQPVIVSQ